MFDALEDDDDNRLTNRFKRAAKPVGLLLAAVPLAGALMAGMGYATQPPVDAATKLLDVSQTDYSKNLESLRQEYLRKSGGGLQIALIDPDSFHLLTALGKTRETAVSILSRHQGVTLDYQQIDSAATQSAKYMRFYDEKMADDLGAMARIGFLPSAQMNQTNDVCVYLPYEFRSDLLQQPTGWSPAQVAEFASRHELTHCLDKRYRDEEEKTQDPGAKFAAAMKREALADVSAFGEMIAKGNDPKMIEGMLHERRTGRDEHFDVSSLIDLEARLSAGGLAAFRALDEQKRDTFYHDIIDRNALDAANAAAFQQLESGSLAISAVRKDPTLVAASRLYDQRLPEGFAPADHYSKADRAEINAYDPLQGFKTATDAEGAIRQRAQLLDELRQQPSSDAVYLAKLEKLNQAFEAQVQPTKTLPRYAALKAKGPKTI